MALETAELWERGSHYLDNSVPKFTGNMGNRENSDDGPVARIYEDRSGPNRLMKIMKLGMDGSDLVDLPTVGLGSKLSQMKYDAESGLTHADQNRVLGVVDQFWSMLARNEHRATLALEGASRQVAPDIHDFGFFLHKGQIYSGLVMDELQGEIPTFHMPDEQKNCFLYNLMRGLGELRLRDVVHADLKPRNTLFRNRDPLDITDFGEVGFIDYACALIPPEFQDLDEGEYNPLIWADPEQDMWGRWKFPDYIGFSRRTVAPEVVRGDTVDCNADSFSAGFIAFEILFGESANDILEQGFSSEARRCNPS